MNEIILENLIEKPYLYAPPIWVNMTQKQRAAVVNGCGPQNARFDFVPDTIYFLSIVDACNIHDFMYHIGQTIEDKAEADRVFLNNMLRLIEREKGFFGKLLKPFRRRRALKYYEMVVAYGGPAFWDGKNPDENKLCIT